MRCRSQACRMRATIADGLRSHSLDQQRAPSRITDHRLDMAAHNEGADAAHQWRGRRPSNES